MPNGETGGGLLERLRNSPRTVSTIIVILIVVGAIFAFSDRGGQAPTPPSPTATGASIKESPAPEEAMSKTKDAGEAEKLLETARPSPAPLPEARETENAYSEVATRGDGVTHLARRAMLRYLDANASDFDVTAEHKVWVEDYLKDQLGRAPLVLGQELAVEKQLIRDAIATSKNLTDAQLKQLQRFSRLVAAYH